MGFNTGTFSGFQNDVDPGKLLTQLISDSVVKMTALSVILKVKISSFRRVQRLGQFDRSPDLKIEKLLR